MYVDNLKAGGIDTEAVVLTNKLETSLNGSLVICWYTYYIDCLDQIAEKTGIRFSRSSWDVFLFSKETLVKSKTSK
jgi:hypothetical protein